MVKIFICLLFISFNAYAQKGVVVVLEAPLFATPNEKTKVVQYLRKGDVIFIHPSELARDRYEGLIQESPQEVLSYDKKYSKEYPDELFPEGGTYFPTTSDRFYKTIAKSGQEAYILKEHIFLYYKDTRELDQKKLTKDPTDYRIEEPLPKGYPLAQPTGYRGQYLFSMGTPSNDSYPYEENIKDSGFNYNKEFAIVWTRQIKWDLSRRFFFGGIFYFHSGLVEHTTEHIDASENLFRMGVGPYLSYDVWKNKKFAFNLFGSIVFNFYDNLEIKQRITPTGGTSFSDKREYKSLHFGSRLGSQFFLKDIFADFDLVIGANINLELPHSYYAVTNPKHDQYWRGSFSRNWSVQQSYFVGFQSDY